jgi:hypothetical protein
LAQVSTVEPSEAAMLAWFAALNDRDDLEARWSAMAMAAMTRSWRKNAVSARVVLPTHAASFMNWSRTT